MEQIKVGDTVRVSRNAQEIFAYGLNPLWFTEESTVVELMCFDYALITLDADNHLAAKLDIPTRHLVRVKTNAEPNEPTIKVGDRVRIKPGFAECLRDLPEEYSHMPFEIIHVNDSSAIAKGYGQSIYLPLCQYELIEPKEPTGISDKIESVSEETANELSDKIEAYVKVMLNIADDFDWQRYEADLAKELAVKMADRHMDNIPSEVGAYVVSVAKSVVKNLKKTAPCE